MLFCWYMEKKNPVGRPSDYTPEIAAKLCEYLSTGESLRTACQREEMPSAQTVFSWMAKHKEFLEQYEQAKEASASADDEVLQDLGDQAIAESKLVGDKRANAVVSAYKLKADNLKWAMSKKKPKKYGDKLDLTSKGEKLPTPILGAYVPTNNGNEKDPSAV